MRLRHAVVKRSFGRIFLHHLKSAYYAEVNDAALTALLDTLAADGAGPAAAMVGRLTQHGMVEAGPCEPLVERSASPLVSIEVEPAGRCNLECGHCFAAFSGAQMSEETFGAVLEGAGVLGAVELTFNGGEPLLNRRTIDWVARASARGLRTLLFTNATLVSATSAGRLARAGLARATVSLDGFEPEHDALRGLGAWRRATRGVRHLVDAGIPVHVTTMVHPGTSQRLVELRRYCQETLGVAGVRLSTVAELGRAAGRPDLQLTAARFRAVYEREPVRKPVAIRGQLPCQAGINKVYVTARGEVHGCHLFEGLARPLGRLHQESLATIYATLADREAARLFTRFGPVLLRACVGCEAFERCGGGCRARAWAMTGNPFGVDPVSCRKHGVERATAHPTAEARA